MSRLTLSLPDELHRALRETAARQGRTQAEIVAESLRLYGLKTEERAEELVARVRESSRVSEEEALRLAVEETRDARR
ncbi:MAG: ribbon-helix-helix protein, CopG family [Thermoanaerobaculia bacterium]|nr:ribbon-helix-helix protein, CopG family [Thermoanaerobaculia bacterium]